MNLLREIFLSFIRVHILYHASKERIFGLEMIKELAEHGYDVSPGTLYPIFHGMEKAGYLDSEREVVSGKVRKYYRITPNGHEILIQMQNKISELSNEILEKS